MTLSKIKSAAAAFLRGERHTKFYTAGVIGAYAALLVASPAEAQTLRSAGESIFNTLYGLVGVLGGIATLASAINWKAGGIIGNDPKKMFFNSLIGTGIGFGVVGIIQFIKSILATGGGISGV